jgi:very-short-patch-repair endonuclease
MGEGQGEGDKMKTSVSFAKNLRKRSTDTEEFLWKRLRAKRFAGLKFGRQEPIGRYIVDFVCYQKRVIIECEGYRVLRFWDNDILKNPKGVMEKIWDTCQLSPSPSSPPINGGDGS